LTVIQTKVLMRTPNMITMFGITYTLSFTYQ